VLITATFDHLSFAELAITELEAKGIAKEKILAIPLVSEDKDFAILLEDINEQIERMI
jgi:hypothetical protein